MGSEGLNRLYPTLPALADELTQAGVDCVCAVSDPKRHFEGVRLWREGMEARRDILYVTDAETLPPEGCAAVVTERKPGRTDILCCPGREQTELLNLLLEIFARFRDWETAMDQLVCRGGSLQELCDLGVDMLDNPVCIHDDWFIMVAMTTGAGSVMTPERVSTSSMGFIPRFIVEDFQHDDDYQETYAHRDAQLWYNSDGSVASLYVNLWDGDIYRGRMLVVRQRRDFRAGDFLLAQALQQRAALLMQRKPLGEQRDLRSMDDRIYALIRGDQVETAELVQLLNLLGWNRSDRFLCVRIRSQQTKSDTLLAHMLHSDLFRVFPRGYILYTEQEQCLILNLTQEGENAAAIRSRLAPLCRDYCMYAGTSSPVSDIRDLSLAYHQAQVALEMAFRLHGDRWNIAFSECAMEYLLEKLDSPLPPMALVSPELLTVREYDRVHGTQYFETLRTYLLEERDIPRTAARLIIHRTTLLYRLKKILPMIGWDLDDPWKRLYLTLSLWILEQEGRKE